MEVINQSFDKLRIDPEQGRMGQNFEGVKNDLFVERERERDCFYLSVSKQIRHPALAFFNLIFSAENPMQFLQRVFSFVNIYIDSNFLLAAQT